VNKETKFIEGKGAKKMNVVYKKTMKINGISAWQIDFG